MKINQSWKRFFVVAGSLFGIAGLIALFLPEYRNLTLLFLYSIPSNSFIPFPHEPAMIFFGRFYAPLLVASAAVVGTLLACFLDYQAINFAFQTPKIKQIRESDVYKGAVHYFLKAPFFAVCFAALAPFIPFYIFRVLSPASGYPFRRYLVAVFLGRFPRYYLFALMGHALNLTNLMIVGGAIFCICAFLCTRVKIFFAARHRHLTQLASTESLSLDSFTVDDKTAIASD